MDVSKSALGKKVSYVDQYEPGLLMPIDRSRHRQAWGGVFPFHGWDAWVGYELSWLNPKGRPEVALLLVMVPANSPFLIESKSFKLYLNSLNQSVFTDRSALLACIEKDLSHVAGKPVLVQIVDVDIDCHVDAWSGFLLDDLDVGCDCYQPNASFLQVDENHMVEETLVSHLLKSNCLVTGQPDWGSIRITYHGPALAKEGLLKYLVSYRQHQGFHEDCVEQIFMDIHALAKFSHLTVEAFYTRRGGLDIRPLRTTDAALVYKPGANRLSRQ